MSVKAFSIPVSAEAMAKLLRSAAPERVPEDVVFIGAIWDPERRVFYFPVITESGLETAEGQDLTRIETIYDSDVGDA